MAKKSGNNLPALFSDEAFETAQAKYDLFIKEAIGYVMNQKSIVVIEQILNYCNITDQVKGYTVFLNLFHSKDMKVNQPLSALHKRLSKTKPSLKLN